MKYNELVLRVNEKRVGRNVRDEVIEWGRRNKVLVSDYVELGGEKGLENCKILKEKLMKDKLWDK